jgi:hypothetical protein
MGSNRLSEWHAREGGNPVFLKTFWTPAFAEVTIEVAIRRPVGQKRKLSNSLSRSIGAQIGRVDMTVIFTRLSHRSFLFLIWCSKGVRQSIR